MKRLNIIPKLLFPIAISLSMTYLAAARELGKDSSHHNKSKPAVESKQLTVNTNDSFRYVTPKSESEGVAEIENLASRCNLEEGWIYLPKETTWYEIGVHSQSSSVILDPTGLETILAKQPEIHFYHSHPTIQQEVEAESKLLYEVIEPLIDSAGQYLPEPMHTLNQMLGSILAAPTSGDVKSMAHTQLSHRNNNKIHVYRVVSETGFFEFSLTNHAMSTLRSIQDPEFIKALDAYNQSWMNLISYNNIIDFFQTENTQHYRQKIADNLSSTFVHVTYTPLEHPPNLNSH